MKKKFLAVLVISIVLNLSACNTTPQKNKNLVSNTLEVNIIQTPELLSQIDIWSEYNAWYIRYNQDVNKNRKIFLEKMKKTWVLCETWYDNWAVGGDILCKNITRYHRDYKIPTRHAVFRAPSFTLSWSSFTPEWTPAVLFTWNRLYAINEKYFYNQELRKKLANHSIDNWCYIFSDTGALVQTNEPCNEVEATTVGEVIDYREIHTNSNQLSFIEVLVQHGFIRDEKDENLRWNIYSWSECWWEIEIKNNWETRLWFPDQETANWILCWKGARNIYYKPWYNYYYLYKPRILWGIFFDYWFPKPVSLFRD